MATATDSRLIVKNLPKYLNEQRLRQHFAQKGEVTDVKLVKNDAGVSRRFGFVGFRTPQEAAAAAHFFNNTFVDTCKINVEVAKPIGDNSLPRPWSKYSKGSSSNDFVGKKNEKTEQLEQKKKSFHEQALAEKQRKEKLLEALYIKPADDPKLNEFLSAMAPRSTKTLWENDDALAKKDAEAVKISKKVSVVKSRKTGGEGVYETKMHITFDDDDDDDNKDGSDDDEYQTLPSIMPKPSEEEDTMETTPANTELSDLDYLKSRMAFDDDELLDEVPKGSKKRSQDEDDQVEEEEEEEEVQEEEEEEESEEAQEEKQDVQPKKDSIKVGARGKDKRTITPQVPLETVAESGRLFIRNLPFTCSEEDITDAFKKFGPLSEVHMPIDKTSKKGKGFAYVLYLMPEHAVVALSKMDGAIFQGRLLHVLPANLKLSEQPETTPSSSVSVKAASFKSQREEKKKAQAGSDVNWNSLFMSSDAVAEAMSSKLSVRKGDLLDAENTGGGDASASMAVRLALAETHIINETKTYLEQEGVVLDVLQQGAKVERSKTIILVKNIPYSTTEYELRSLFGGHGDLVRVVVPPTRTMALIEFSQPTEARAAFKQLAYAKFKHLPLYLEWAPIGIFSGPARQPTVAALPEPVMLSSKQEEESIDDENTQSIFVKNLSFSTTESSLRSVFEAVGPVKNVTITTKKDPKNNGNMLSMGFGFVEFLKQEDTETAMKTLQNYELDGHRLQLKISHRGGATESRQSKNGVGAAKPNAAKSTKMVVRNVPFEATVREIRELFKPFGELKSVRLPKKFDGTHRGFAFVDFLTHQDAKTAYGSLSNTHLYGRHLVIEWAKEDDTTVDALRAKTATQLRGAQQMQQQALSRKRQRLTQETDEYNGMGKDDDAMDSD